MGALISRPVKFAEINARCRALRASLLKHEFFTQAASSKTLGDLHLMLSGSVYAPFISDASREGLENGIEKAFSSVYRHLTSILNKKEKRVFDLFFVHRKKFSSAGSLHAEKDPEKDSGKEAEKNYMEMLTNSLKQLGGSEKKDLREIIGSYFDMLNIYTVVRLRILYRMEPEEILPFMLPYGLFFDLKLLGALSGASTLSELSSILDDRIDISFETYEEFRAGINGFHKRVLDKVWYGYPFKISVIFSLLRLREIEAGNLKALTEGVHYRLPGRDMESMLLLQQ